jgi:hypothetical protein
MAENKTKVTNQNVYQFIDTNLNSEQKIKDSHRIIEIMKQVTGCEPRMWGPSIIGFGSYHYSYDSGHKGEAPILGFSPRKAAISLYITYDNEKQRSLIDRLGLFKEGKACLYVKKLSDIDENVLKALMSESFSYITAHFPDHAVK